MGDRLAWLGMDDLVRQFDHPCHKSIDCGKGQGPGVARLCGAPAERGCLGGAGQWVCGAS